MGADNFVLHVLTLQISIRSQTKFEGVTGISQKDEACFRLGQKLPMHEADDGGLVVDICKKKTLDKDSKPKSQRREDYISNEAFDNSFVIVNSSKEAADWIGTFRNYPNCTGKGIGEFDSSLHLDLSLKRCHPSGFWNEHAEKVLIPQSLRSFSFLLNTSLAVTRYQVLSEIVKLALV